MVVLKTVSPEQQWFSSMLQPYVHYIPITLTPFEVPTSEFERARRTNTSLRQSSDVVQQIQWAIRNPEFCARILENANLFYQRYLSDEAMECYFRGLMHRISSLYTFNATTEVENILSREGIKCLVTQKRKWWSS